MNKVVITLVFIVIGIFLIQTSFIGGGTNNEDAIMPKIQNTAGDAIDNLDKLNDILKDL